ncbi:MAG: GNAT family N-acetyltransferase [Bacterioplanes sp.]|nr:GNAT family N-acetyltransferase [Bacterioplanes sp.]
MEVIHTQWQSHRDVLQHIRRRVFIDEQSVPETLEWDDDDLNAMHFIAYDGQRPMGCARLLKDGTLGRMAVLIEHRGSNVGSLLLRSIEQYAQQTLHLRAIRASVQTRAYTFYHRNGFAADTDFCWDANIAHVVMHKTLGLEQTPSERFILGSDYESYHVTEQHTAAAAGLLHIALQDRSTRVVLAIADLTEPVWRDQGTRDSILYYLRQSRQRRIAILLQQEYAGIADHPLIQFSQRLSSRIEVRVHSEIAESFAIFNPHGYIKLERAGVRACFNNRPICLRLNDYIDNLWRTSQRMKEGRRLRL